MRKQSYLRAKTNAGSGWPVSTERTTSGRRLRFVQATLLRLLIAMWVNICDLFSRISLKLSYIDCNGIWNQTFYQLLTRYWFSHLYKMYILSNKHSQVPDFGRDKSFSAPGYSLYVLKYQLWGRNQHAQRFQQQPFQAGGYSAKGDKGFHHESAPSCIPQKYLSVLRYENKNETEFF